MGDRRAPMFEHMIPPDFPCLLIAGGSWFNFGPYRAVNTAEYIVHHFCRERVSEEDMKRSAARLVSKQDAFRLAFFRNDSCWVQDWLMFFEETRPSSVRFSYSALSKQRSDTCGSALPAGVA